MKIAAVEAIAALAREAPSDVAARAYGGEARIFGRGSLIPTPFDPRLILRIAPAVASAAMESGVATRPIADFDGLSRAARPLRVPLRLHHEAGLRRRRRRAPKRVIYADGEDERVLRAAQVVLEEGLAQPILIGRPAVIETRLKRFGLSIRPGRDFELDQSRGRSALPRLCRRRYVEVAGRRGVTPDAARTLVRTNATVIAALAVQRGEADAMICGLEGRFMSHLRHIRDIIGLAPGVSDFAALTLIITAQGRLSSSPTPMCSPIRPPRRSPRWRCSPPRMSAASASSRRSRCCRIPISAATTAQSARKMRARREPAAADAIRNSRSTARCTAIRRCRRRSASASARIRASRARPMC